MNVPLSRPDITDLERRYVLEVLQTPALSLGPLLPRFEAALAARAGARHAVAVNSGTSALHLIVRAMGLGPGDEVITTPFSFIASANCILFERATPVFADIDPATLNLDPAQVEAALTPRTRAILAVDVFGLPAPWDELRDIAARRGLWLIEDSAEAIGATYRGRPAGGLGDAGVFAFYPNKQMTTGEGGAVLTSHEELAALCRSMRSQGRDEGDSWLQHTRLGFNYRLSEVNCALGLAQVERLDDLLAARAAVARAYHQRLAKVPGLELLPFQVGDAVRSWFVYVVRLAPQYPPAARDALVRGLREEGIGCGVYFPPIHLMPLYRESFGYSEGAFPIAEAIGARCLALPFHSRLTPQEVDHVASALERLLAALPASRTASRR